MLQSHQGPQRRKPQWSEGQKLHAFWVQENTSSVPSCLLPLLLATYLSNQVVWNLIKNQEPDF